MTIAEQEQFNFLKNLDNEQFIKDVKEAHPQCRQLLNFYRK